MLEYLNEFVRPHYHTIGILQKGSISAGIKPVEDCDKTMIFVEIRIDT